MHERVTPIKPLVCAQCLRADRDGHGRGWKADLAGGHDGEELELVILWSSSSPPRCATAPQVTTAA